MLRELTRAKILLIFTFLVAILAIYYHPQSNDDSSTSSPTFEKTDYGGRNSNNDQADSSIEEIEMEPDDDVSPDEQSSAGEIVANSDENDDKIYSTPPKYKHTKDTVSIMSTLMDVLNLTNKTAEEKRKELYVNFSTLDTHKFPEDKKTGARVLLSMYREVLDPSRIRELVENLHPSERTKYDLRKFNNGIVALGVENFMKAATQFCKEEAAAGEIPIVSIGSGDGTVEKEIIAQYRERFDEEIRIQLVDPDPKFDGIVDFKTVDHLIAENPSIVGNCVALIIWPNPVSHNMLNEYGKEIGYDLEAVQKLQPRAALTVYESMGGSGSDDFRGFLHEDSLDDIPSEEFGLYNWMYKVHFSKKENYGLDNYAVREVARQKVVRPLPGTSIFRMVKIVRSN